MISVIVPVYRVEPWLDRCVESILAQTCPDFELILVDDGSPDRCGEMCDAWARKDARIRAFHKANGGLSSARNFGLDRARGDSVTFVDSDDFVRPDYLRHLLSLLADCPDADYAETSLSVIRDGRESPRDGSGERLVLAPADAMRRMLYDDRLFTAAWGKLFRRAFIDRFRFTEGRLYEEILLCAEYVPAARKVVYGGFPDYAYFIRENSITTARFDEANLRQHLEAADVLTAAAERMDPSLASAALRYRMFSRLRMLRFMHGGEGERAGLAAALRAEVLAAAPALRADPRLPRRDRMALRLLAIGLRAYWFGWACYVRFRK